MTEQIFNKMILSFQFPFTQGNKSDVMNQFKTTVSSGPDTSQADGDGKQGEDTETTAITLDESTDEKQTELEGNNEQVEPETPLQKRKKKRSKNESVSEHDANNSVNCETMNTSGDVNIAADNETENHVGKKKKHKKKRDN